MNTEDKLQSKPTLARLKSEDFVLESSSGVDKGRKKVSESLESEVWKLRCKVLSEKYFHIIRDLKDSLKQLRSDHLSAVSQA